MTDFNELVRDPVSRRAFLARMTAAGLGAAAATMLAGCGGGGNGTSNTPTTPGGSTVTFFDKANFPGIPGKSENEVVLNYALTLETTEADLYRQALNLASGFSDYKTRPLSSNTSSYALNVPLGGLSTTDANVGFLYLKQYAAVEAAHRDFLHDVAIPSISGTPVEPPARGYKFAPSNNDLKTILTLIRVVEETGVTAYLGAAGFLTQLDLIQVAASIYSTEARHSAALNYVLGLDAGPSGDAGGKQPVSGYAKNDFEYAQKPATVIATVTQNFFA